MSAWELLNLVHGFDEDLDNKCCGKKKRSARRELDN
jgi:hypothetical protein